MASHQALEYGLKMMWIVYAFAAALCWGMSYAACGPLLKKGLHPLYFLLGYSFFGLLGAVIALASMGKLSLAIKYPLMDRSDLGWFLFSVSVSALGAYLTYAAMDAKNPTLVSLIEISYPLFVVIFAWVFFREMQLNPMTLCGGFLVLAGVAIIVLGER